MNLPILPGYIIPPTPGQVIPLASGETLTIGAEIGRGAFGIVHEAVDDFENRLVVKTLSPQMGTYAAVRENWSA